MKALLVFLSFLLGYASAEWPRLIRCRKREAIPLARLADPRERQMASMHPAWVLVLTVPWTFVGMSLGRKLAPASLWDEYWFLWCVFLVLTASGLATGVFEQATGMTPAQLWINSSSVSARFYCDRELAVRNGELRVLTCVAMAAFGLLGFYFL